MYFNEMSLDERIQKVLEEQQYQMATPIQEQAIPLLLKGKDLLGCAETGTGKTATFALPILNKLSVQDELLYKNSSIKALVLAPTRELAIQIERSFQIYSKYLEIRMALLFGGVSPKYQIKQIRNNPAVLIATPGRLIDLIKQGYVDISHISMFVLDEADRMLDLGMSKDVKKIISLLPEQRQTMFFSATMPQKVLDLARDLLISPIYIDVTKDIKGSVDIKESLYFVKDIYKTALLLELIKDESLKSLLVFVNTQRKADKVCKLINKTNRRAKAIHGGKTQQARMDALEMFKVQKIQILIATDIAARGINIKDITHVINMDLPQKVETYTHRIGRTGRAGKNGEAISFCSLGEVELLQRIEKSIGYQITEIENHDFLPLYMVFVRTRL